MINVKRDRWNMKLGVIYNLDQIRQEQMILDFFNWLEEKQIEYFYNNNLSKITLPNSKAMDKYSLIKKADILLVLGGDGSMLEIARKSSPFKKPILGINLGKLGFLTDVDLVDVKAKVEEVLKGNYYIEERMLLKAEYEDRTLYALNDIIVHKGLYGRIIQLKVSINSAFFSKFTADGLIISTPTGSTAYNLSNQGPVIEPNVESVILNPVSPHALAMRPIIVSDKSKISVEILTKEKGIIISGDAQETINFNEDSSLLIQKSKEKALLIKFKDYSFYNILRKKLGWGDFSRK